MKKLTNILILFSLILLFNGNVMAGDDPFSEARISIYPNPVMYEANISLDKKIDLSDSEVSLYFFNVVGEVVYSVEGINQHDFRVNKDAFRKSGIYLFQLQMNGEVLKTGKINVH